MTIYLALTPMHVMVPMHGSALLCSACVYSEMILFLSTPELTELLL